MWVGGLKMEAEHVRRRLNVEREIVEMRLIANPKVEVRLITGFCFV
jgi:hypothetical protein